MLANVEGQTIQQSMSGSRHSRVGSGSMSRMTFVWSQKSLSRKDQQDMPSGNKISSVVVDVKG